MIATYAISSACQLSVQKLCCKHFFYGGSRFLSEMSYQYRANICMELDPPFQFTACALVHAGTLALIYRSAEYFFFSHSLFS